MFRRNKEHTKSYDLQKTDSVMCIYSNIEF